MTTIERLWDKAKNDPEQKAIQEALSVEMALVCDDCGGRLVRGGKTGRYTCLTCGQVVCGDS